MKPILSSQFRRAFTLIELRVVVSIIALLISILRPSLQRTREQAKLAVCHANLSGIGKAPVTYVLDLNSLPIVTEPSYFHWALPWNLRLSQIKSLTGGRASDRNGRIFGFR